MKLTTTRLRQIIKEEMYRMSRGTPSRLKEARDDEFGDIYNPEEENAALDAAMQMVKRGLPAKFQNYLETGGEVAIGTVVDVNEASGKAVINLRIFAVTPASESFGYAKDSFTNPVTGEEFTIAPIEYGIPTQVKAAVVTGPGGNMKLTPSGRRSIEAQLMGNAGFAWVPDLNALIESPDMNSYMPADF